jgi:hypothetical protein
MARGRRPVVSEKVVPSDDRELIALIQHAARLVLPNMQRNATSGDFVTAVHNALPETCNATRDQVKSYRVQLDAVLAERSVAVPTSARDAAGAAPTSADSPLPANQGLAPEPNEPAVESMAEPSPSDRSTASESKGEPSPSRSDPSAAPVPEDAESLSADEFTEDGRALQWLGPPPRPQQFRLSRK